MAEQTPSVVVTSPSGANQADVQSSVPNGTEQALVVRNIPSGTQVVGDGGGTLTVDGTVTANVGTTGGLALDATLTDGTQAAIVRGGAKGSTTAANVTSTSINPNVQALHVSAQGTTVVSGTATVTQGTATVAGNAWPIKVTDGVDTAEVTAANALKVDGSAVTQPVSVSGVMMMSPDNTVSAANSTTSTLLAAAVFTGTYEDVHNYAAVNILIATDQQSAVSGVELVWSTDGTNEDKVEVLTSLVGPFSGSQLLSPIRGRYFKFRYTNGAVDQTHLRIQTTYSRITPASSVRIDTSSFWTNSEPFTPIGGARSNNLADLAAGESGVVKITAKRALHVTPRTEGGSEFASVSDPAFVTMSSLPLPTDAATETTLATLATEATLQARLNVLGQNAMAGSTPVTIASDQTGIPVHDNSGSLTVDNGGTFAIQDSQKLADSAAFTATTTKIEPVGFVVDDITTNLVFEGQAGAARMDGKRAQILVIEDASAVGTRAKVGTAAPSAGDAGLVVRNIPSGVQEVSNSNPALLQATVSGYDGAAERALLVDATGSPLVQGAQTGGAAVATKPILVGGSDGTNAQIVKTDTSGNIVTSPLLVSTSTVSAVAASVTVVTLVASTVGRRGLFLYNDSASAVYVKLGTAATSASFTKKMVADSYYELPSDPMYTNIVTAIWVSATGNMLVTELT